MVEEDLKEGAESTALVNIERSSAQDVFTSPAKVNDILAQLRGLVIGEIYSADTPEGRARIKAQVRKLKKTKSVGDDIGKELVAELKDLPKRIDAGRKQFRDGVDVLVAEISAPLTAWEAEQERIKREQAEAERREQERQRAVDAAIQRMAIMLTDYVGQHSTIIRQAIDDLDEPDPEFFGERLAEAQGIWASTITKLTHMAEQAEALEKADADRQAREAADLAARREQEASRQRELDAQVAARQAQQEKADAERRAQEADARAKQAQEEADRKVAQAKADAEAAERKRLADQQEAERKAAEQRAADVRHRKAINNAAANALIEHAGVDMQVAKKVIIAIFEGKVPAISITY